MAEFSRKLVCICPVCKEPIYGNMLQVQNIDLSQIKVFPFSFDFFHSKDKNKQSHRIKLYFDANLSVRDIEN